MFRRVYEKVPRDTLKRHRRHAVDASIEMAQVFLGLRILSGLDEAYRALLRPAPWLNPPVPESTMRFLEGAFGEPISVADAVQRIIKEIHERGDDGVRDLARRFDGAELSALEVSREEIARAYDRVDTEVIDALHVAAAEIEAFHVQQSRQSWLDFGRGVGQMVRPIHRAGLFAPGGLAAYPSTVLMTAVPAKVADVPEVVLSTLGRDRGEVPPVALVAASIAKVDRVFRIGGPIAIAAMAVGTESMPKATKVFGPGNLLVQLVKRAVYGIAGVDALQGPSETIVVADDRADPALCAADLLAQAEHDTDSRPILVATSQRLVTRVERGAHPSVGRAARGVSSPRFDRGARRRGCRRDARPGDRVLQCVRTGTPLFARQRTLGGRTEDHCGRCRFCWLRFP